MSKMGAKETMLIDNPIRRWTDGLGSDLQSLEVEGE